MSEDKGQKERILRQGAVESVLKQLEVLRHDYSEKKHDIDSMLLPPLERAVESERRHGNRNPSVTSGESLMDSLAGRAQVYGEFIDEIEKILCVGAFAK